MFKHIMYTYTTLSPMSLGFGLNTYVDLHVIYSILYKKNALPMKSLLIPRS